MREMSAERGSIVVSVQLTVEFEHARAFAGWGAFHFNPWLGGGPIPIAVERSQQTEPRYVFFRW